MGITLMIGSCEPFSGKSALVLGIARQLIASNQNIRFGKPLATSFEVDASASIGNDLLIDDDVRFVGNTLGLTDSQLIPSLELLSASTAEKRLRDSFLEPCEGFHSLCQSLNKPFNGLTL